MDYYRIVWNAVVEAQRAAPPSQRHRIKRRETQ